MWSQRLYGLGILVLVCGCGETAEPTATDMQAAAAAAPSSTPVTNAEAGRTATMAAGKPVSANAAGSVASPARPAAMSGSSSMAASAPAVAGSPAAATSGDVPASAAGSGASAAGAMASVATAGSSAGASGGAAGAAGARSRTHEDLGKGDGSDVITIGDSWMSFVANGGGIEAGLRAASMQPYRNYGFPGTMLLDEVIPDQYESAKRANPDIKTVVMTGGGNDLLLTGMGGNGCTENCMMTIDKVAARLETLWKEMGEDGVQDLVYIEYSQGGDNGDAVGYGHTKLVPLCAAAAPIRCHLLHSDDFIMMMLLDGVHPTMDGCTKLGKAVYALMEKEGMRR